jgi:hypothetical protein
MRNTNWRRFVGALVITAAALAGTLVTAQPALAAGSCNGSAGAAVRPVALSGGRFVLANTRTRGYTGTPFSFRLRVERGGFPSDTVSEWYTYDNNRRGYTYKMTTGKLAPGRAAEVQTWCGGKRGGDWRGGVYSK